MSAWQQRVHWQKWAARAAQQGGATWVGHSRMPACKRRASGHVQVAHVLFSSCRGLEEGEGASSLRLVITLLMGCQPVLETAQCG